jgi:SAM-dependent methyltransferase
VSILRTIRRWGCNARRLILTGRWGEFGYNCRKLWWSQKLKARGVDLDFVSNEELGLNVEVSGAHAVSPGFEIERILRELKIPPGSSIIDMGCGKGITLITFARFPGFSRIAGCDISPELIDIAEKNLLRLGIKGAALYCCDAAAFTGFDDFDYVYLFNPFYGEPFDRMMDNLTKSLIRSPRPLTIVYRNPSCHETVVASGDFVKQREFVGGQHPYFIYCHRPK